jgi:hypothetical protein
MEAVVETQRDLYHMQAPQKLVDLQWLSRCIEDRWRRVSCAENVVHGAGNEKVSGQL